jgi:hypothetical protein
MNTTDDSHLHFNANNLEKNLIMSYFIKQLHQLVVLLFSPEKWDD